MFPSDDILLARGKFSTLSHERHEQLKRVQDICTTLVTEAQASLRDCEQKPPKEAKHIQMIGKCLENLTSARERIIMLSLGMNELEPEAWPK